MNKFFRIFAVFVCFVFPSWLPSKEIISLHNCEECKFWKTRYFDDSTARAFTEFFNSLDEYYLHSFFINLFRLYAYETKGLLCSNFSSKNSYKEIILKLKSYMKSKNLSLSEYCEDPLKAAELNEIPEFDEEFKLSFANWFEKDGDTQQSALKNSNKTRIFELLSMSLLTASLSNSHDSLTDLEIIIKRVGGLESFIFKSFGCESLRDYKEISESFRKIFCVD